MPELAPFPALRFAPSAGDLSQLLAPPYDVVDPSDAADLRARSGYNCVRLILPEGTPGDRYEKAAELLRRWVSDGVLTADEEPAAYVYRQEYEVDGVRTERLAVFAALRLSPFDQGEVLPHERTHSGPKEDRLALTLATRTQLSPIFMVARDADAALYDLELAVASDAPDAVAVTPDGIGHSLWIVTGDRCEAMLSASSAHPLLIADGHHRYETALAASELLSDSVKAAYLLVCVVSQRDPGLIVRPTHRILHRPPADADDGFGWLAALEGSFRLAELGSLTPLEAEERAADAAPGSFIVHPGGREAGWLALARPEAIREAGIPPERARIAPVVFDELVLRGLYGFDADQASHEGVLAYSRQPGPASEVLLPGCGFILPPVSLEDVWTTAARGGRLPPKSTYFEPKMPSGLLFRPL